MAPTRRLPAPIPQELPLAFSKRPSYLKRQKEQQRLARAAEKREARHARRRSRDEGTEPGVDADLTAVDDTGANEAGLAEGDAAEAATPDTDSAE